MKKELLSVDIYLYQFQLTTELKVCRTYMKHYMLINTIPEGIITLVYFIYSLRSFHDISDFSHCEQ